MEVSKPKPPTDLFAEDVRELERRPKIGQPNKPPPAAVRAEEPASKIDEMVSAAVQTVKDKARDIVAAVKEKISPTVQSPVRTAERANRTVDDTVAAAALPKAPSAVAQAIAVDRGVGHAKTVPLVQTAALVADRGPARHMTPGASAA